MKTLDERLKAIRKIDVSDAEMYRQKREIIQRVSKPKQSFVPIAVTCVMFAILCFLVFIPTAKQNVPQQATALEQLEIKEWIVLNNARPKSKFNLDSANYIGRYVVDNEAATKAMHQYLVELSDQVVPWDEAYVQDYSVYDIQINFTNGQSIYLKYSGNWLYDTTNEVKHNLTSDQGSEFLSLLLDEQIKSDRSIGIILWIIFLLLAIIFTFDWVYRKKYAILDERGAQKRLPYWITFICTLLFMSPIPLMNLLLGTVHLGLICIMIVCYVFIVSQLEIKLGVIRPNNIHYKFLLPLYITLFMIAIVLITVV